jgi:hypothetical protein
MSDVALPIQEIVTAALKGDAALKTMFSTHLVRLYDVPAVNAPSPYLTVGEDSISELEGEGLDLSEVEATVHIWSLTNPPGKSEAKRLGGRVKDVLLALADGPVIRTTWRVAERYFMDADGVTCHGVVTIGMAYEPA